MTGNGLSDRPLPACTDLFQLQCSKTMKMNMYTCNSTTYNLQSFQYASFDNAIKAGLYLGVCTKKLFFLIPKPKHMLWVLNSSNQIKLTISRFLILKKTNHSYTHPADLIWLQNLVV